MTFGKFGVKLEDIKACRKYGAILVEHFSFASNCVVALVLNEKVLAGCMFLALSAT